MRIKTFHDIKIEKFKDWKVHKTIYWTKIIVLQWWKIPEWQPSTEGLGYARIFFQNLTRDASIKF